MILLESTCTLTQAYVKAAVSLNILVKMGMSSVIFYPKYFFPLNLVLLPEPNKVCSCRVYLKKTICMYGAEM